MTFFQGLVFKWGSLVGLSLPSSGADNTSPFVTADVVFRPTGFTTVINTWTSVPYCTTDFVNYGNTATAHLATVNDPAAGIGDICRYMGIVDGSPWRMPTAAEFAELYGSDQENKGQAVKLGNGWIQGNYYPLSGYAMGPNRNNVVIIGDDVNARVTGASKTDGAVFLPASGRRNLDNGTIYNIGTYGYYWSSTAITIGNSNDILFNSTDVTPQNSAIRRYAFSIRCIRE